MGQIDKCLYCKKPGTCLTVEHPVPESLGNDRLVLKDAVCDGCQNALAVKVEGPALANTFFGFWRSHLGIPTKKGKLPSSDTRPPQAGGAIPTGGGRNQPGLTIAASEDGVPRINFHSEEGLIISDDRHHMSYTFKLTPWHFDVISRFMAKMAIGVLCCEDRAVAMSTQYDELREYARYGTLNRLWPVFMGKYGSLNDLSVGRIVGDRAVYETRLPSWSFIQIDLERLFVFWIGTDLFLLNMDSRSTTCPIVIGDPLEKPKCLWYSPEQIHDRKTR